MRNTDLTVVDCLASAALSSKEQVHDVDGRVLRTDVMLLVTRMSPLGPYQKFFGNVRARGRVWTSVGNPVGDPYRQPAISLPSKQIGEGRSGPAWIDKVYLGISR